jgi:hypothetical protein
MWLLGGTAALLLALDRAVARGVLDRRRPRKRRAASGGGASGALGELVDVFQPSRTHVTDEQERQRHDRQDAGDAAPPVDLDAGTAHVDAAPRRSRPSTGHEWSVSGR